MTQPENAVIFYQGLVEEGDFVGVTVDQGETAMNPFRIPATFLQWGYKLYGTGYNLINITDDSCVPA